MTGAAIGLRSASGRTGSSLGIGRVMDLDKKGDAVARAAAAARTSKQAATLGDERVRALLGDERRIQLKIRASLGGSGGGFYTNDDSKSTSSAAAVGDAALAGLSALHNGVSSAPGRDASETLTTLLRCVKHGLQYVRRAYTPIDASSGEKRAHKQYERAMKHLCHQLGYLESLFRAVLATRKHSAAVGRALWRDNAVMSASLRATQRSMASWWSSMKRIVYSDTLACTAICAELQSWRFFQHAPWEQWHALHKQQMKHSNYDIAASSSSAASSTASDRRVMRLEQSMTKLRGDKRSLLEERKKLLHQLKKFARHYDGSSGSSSSSTKAADSKQQQLLSPVAGSGHGTAELLVSSLAAALHRVRDDDEDEIAPTTLFGNEASAARAAAAAASAVGSSSSSSSSLFQVSKRTKTTTTTTTTGSQ
jgi:hypothetical protein